MWPEQAEKVTKREDTGRRAREPGTGHKGARRAGQAGGQMEPLHLAMMRAL